MERIANRRAVWGLVALLSVGLGRSAAAQMADTTGTAVTANAVTVETVVLTVYRTKEPAYPPAPKRETKPLAPSPSAAWVAGFWDLRGDRATAPRAGWNWVPGRWITPPVPQARWDPGHWGFYDEWYSWIPGHWVVPNRHGYPPGLQADEMTEHEMSAP